MHRMKIGQIVLIAMLGLGAFISIIVVLTVPDPFSKNPLNIDTAGMPSYADMLNNPNNTTTHAAQWDVSGDVFGNKCELGLNKNYHVIQTFFLWYPLNLHACHEDSYAYVNTVIEVNVTILKGDSGGLFLRYNKDPLGNYTGYLFEIDHNHNYKFSIFTGNNILSPLIVLQDWSTSPALKAGYNVTNQIAVIVTDNTFELYANDTHIATLTDPSKTYNYGDVGFFASAPDADTDVAFNNLQVWQQS